MLVKGSIFSFMLVASAAGFGASGYADLLGAPVADGPGAMSTQPTPPPDAPYPPFPDPNPYPYPSEQVTDPFIPDSSSVSMFDQDRDGCVSNAEIAATLNSMDPPGSSASSGNEAAFLGALLLDAMLGQCQDD